jgi:hypothetical protein
MSHTFTVILLLAALAAGACSQAGSRNAGGPARNDQSAPSTAPNTTTPAADGQAKNQVAGDNSAPLTTANNSQNNAAAIERKIIKNATLALDVAQPSDAQQKITAIAEAKGGFVVSTDARQQSGDENAAGLTVTVVARVPAAQFEATLTAIRATAIRVREEKQTGQDVTEEFIDLDARLKAQQALEAQFMEIMKQAKTVTEALEVQRELATVRGEIERIQGRLRFLQNQADLSSITVTLSQPAPFLGSTTGFWASLKNAFSDGLWVATAILLFLIRAAVALAPVIVLIFLPIGLLWWYLVRRWRRAWTARKLAKQEMERTWEVGKPPEP